MTCSIVGTALTFSSQRESPSRQRTHTIIYRVQSDFTDGPWNVMNTPGIATVGSVWNPSGFSDLDPWAIATPYLKVTPIQPKEGQKVRLWNVEQQFSTQGKGGKRCQDTEVEDPLLEPQRIGGSFNHQTREMQFDKDGNVLRTISHERLLGVEFDDNYPQVWVEQNVSSLELEDFSLAVNRVNSVNMWGLPPRRIKLGNVTWERKYKGVCEIYFTRRFEFDVSTTTDGWDRYVLEQGRLVLRGHWDATAGPSDTTNFWVTDGSPDLNSPADFIRARDPYDNPIDTLYSAVHLGEPFVYSPMDGSEFPKQKFIAYYQEYNFFLLGIPVSLS